MSYDERMKDRSFYILITAMVLLSVLAVLLIFFIFNADYKYEDNIRVKENGITETLIPVRDLVLSPGVEKDYDVKLICDASGSYFIHIDFQEREDGGMKEFVNVIVEYDGEQVYEGKLTELIDEGFVIEGERELHAQDPMNVTFRYVMPLETGNEAQGTYSYFDVHIVIKKS